MRVNKIEFTKNRENYAFYFPIEGKKQALSFKDILNGKKYPLLKAFQPRIILDVGANLGATSMFFALNYPKAKIFSFEPTKMNFSWLKKNTERFQNVIRVNKGAYFEDTKTKIYLDSEVGGRNSIFKHWSNSDKYEVIDLLNFGKYLKSKELTGTIDILKIDTEGCEIDILRSIEYDLQNIGVIYLEYHGKEDEEVVMEILSKSHVLVQKKAVSKQSRKVSLELLGSVCIEDVNIEGKTILQSGKKITEAHIRELQALSIQTISISSDSLGELLFVNKKISPK